MFVFFVLLGFALVVLGIFLKFGGELFFWIGTLLRAAGGDVTPNAERRSLGLAGSSSLWVSR